MITRGTTLIVLLLISNLAFSQPGYPRQILLGSDSVIAITRSQMRTLNNLHLSYQECSDKQDSLMDILDSCTVAFYTFRHSDSILNQCILLKTAAIQERDTLIKLQSQVISTRDTYIDRLKLSRRMYIIGAAIITGIMTYFAVR